MSILTQENFVSVALAPDADVLTGTVTTDVYNLKLYDHITFFLMVGVGATGTTTITVEEATDNAGAGATAIAFNSRIGADTGVALGAVVQTPATGLLTIAGSNKLTVVEVDAADLSDGSNFVRLKLVEAVDSPVDAAIFAVLSKASYAEATMPDATI